MPAKNRDLHGNVPDASRVALLLIDVIDVIDDFEYEDGAMLLAQALPVAERRAAFKARGRSVAERLLPAAATAVRCSRRPTRSCATST